MEIGSFILVLMGFRGPGDVWDCLNDKTLCVWSTIKYCARPVMLVRRALCLIKIVCRPVSLTAQEMK